MSTFAWVMLGIAVFIGGQWMMMRPGARDQALMHLRESARKKACNRACWFRRSGFQAPIAAWWPVTP